MKAFFYILPLILLSACAGPQVTSQRMMVVDGNRLQVTSGTMRDGRYVTVENVEKQWHGRMKGGKEKWKFRAGMLNNVLTHEIGMVCGDTFFRTIRPPTYKMMDKDETMGGMAPVLGIAASMAAHLAADSATDPANVPVSVYAEFGCPSDDQ